jgi:methionine-rich copper-binding protein CopC
MRIVQVIGSAAALVFISGVAGAHAFLEQAEPRVGSNIASAPREVTLRFTQDIEPAFSSATITDASGQRVDVGKPVISGNLMRLSLREIGAGSYRVSWHVLSVDTHTTEGAFNFGVDTP